jgi:hypothetical protein
MIGFLHTAALHTTTFSDLLDEVSPGAASTHVAGGDYSVMSI